MGRACPVRGAATRILSGSPRGRARAGGPGVVLRSGDGYARCTIRPDRSGGRVARRHAYRVYLAGPISGCNDPQKRRWRDTVKRKYGSKMTFIDSVEMLVDREASPYEFVEADLWAIEEADGLLVNMWRESIGTAIGVAHAHLRSRTIVVCDPNHLNNSMLAFFADAVADTPLQGPRCSGTCSALSGTGTSPSSEGERSASSVGRSWRRFAARGGVRDATTSPCPSLSCRMSSTCCIARTGR